MKFSSKDQNHIKIKNYIKYTNFFCCYCGLQQNSIIQLETQQKLKLINFKSYKIYNKISTKIFEKSIYKNSISAINSITFFIKPNSNKVLITKKILFNIKFFVFLVMRFNQNIYSLAQIKQQIKSFNYYNSKLLLYQFFLTNLKSKFFN